MEKQIEIRRAEEKDIKKVMDLLSQVLEIHAKIRPDVFVSGTTKYTDAELLQMFEDDQNPVYVAVVEKDQVVGYALQIKTAAFKQYGAVYPHYLSMI